MSQKQRDLNFKKRDTLRMHQVSNLLPRDRFLLRIVQLTVEGFRGLA